MIPNTSNFGVVFDCEALEKKLSTLKDQSEADPDFWQNVDKSTKVLKQIKQIQSQLSKISTISQLSDDLNEYADIVSSDQMFLSEAIDTLNKSNQLIESLELFQFLGGELDDKDAYLSIQPGAGGVESHDWAAMILRMYQRFSQKMDWNFDMLSFTMAHGNGLKHCECHITGADVYGYLKAEHGVHRLIRISPFDSNDRRHTSFASVIITPSIDDKIEVKINPADIRIDTYRASGAGGQHVNKTDSAVRITHIPSKIVVQSQSQRSQHQNKDKCFEVLRSKLYAWQKQKKDQEKNALITPKSSISFGSQIRTYTLHPFKLVKDHRTNYQSTDPSSILDGELSSIIKSYLQK